MSIFRTLAKQLPHPLLCRLYHRTRYRQESIRAARAATDAGLPLLGSLDITSLRTSHTLFILGSAWSINEISDVRWDVIGKHDSVGINFWPAHPFVPRLYHFEDVAHDEQPVMYDAFHTLFERRAVEYASTVKIITEIQPYRPKQLVSTLSQVMKKNMYVGFSLPVPARNENELRSGIRYMRSMGVFERHDRVDWLFKYGGSVTAMMALAVLMGHKRIILCGVDLNRQNYFYQQKERYPEYADWEFASKSEPHLTTRQLPWLVPAQTAVHVFREEVLDPLGIELFVESNASTLHPRVPLATQSLFDELGQQDSRTFRAAETRHTSIVE